MSQFSIFRNQNFEIEAGTDGQPYLLFLSRGEAGAAHDRLNTDRDHKGVRNRKGPRHFRIQCKVSPLATLLVVKFVRLNLCLSQASYYQQKPEGSQSLGSFHLGSLDARLQLYDDILRTRSTEDRSSSYNDIAPCVRATLVSFQNCCYKPRTYQPQRRRRLSSGQHRHRLQYLCQGIEREARQSLEHSAR